MKSPNAADILRGRLQGSRHCRLTHPGVKLVLVGLLFYAGMRASGVIDPTGAGDAAAEVQYTELASWLTEVLIAVSVCLHLDTRAGRRKSTVIHALVGGAAIIALKAAGGLRFWHSYK